MSAWRLLALFLPALALCPVLRGFVYIEDLPPWPEGTVTLQLQLGSSPTYSDGTTPNSTAIEALQAWNPSMARVQFTYVNNSPATKSRTNGRNNVFFDSTVYGSAFGDGVLAITVGRHTDAAPIEMDVVVNRGNTWDSYRGDRRAAVDLRRVLIHEFGHVLGLDHPDDHGQWADAIMLAQVSDRDTVQQDDMDGASARYGRGAGNPLVPPTIVEHPQDLSTSEGHAIVLIGMASGSNPLSYQWFKDGVEISGATTNLIQFMVVRVTDAGKYQLRVSNEAGSVMSNEALLSVAPATPPVFRQHPPSTVAIEVGSSFNLDAWATNILFLTYQWTRDGVDIPGATSTYLTFTDAKSSDSGTYRLVATNIAGSVSSDPCVVTILPPQPPRFISHPTSLRGIVGASVGLWVQTSSRYPVTYQWTRDGVAIPGATDTTFRIEATTAADAATYHVIATSSIGSTTSNPAILTLDPLPPPSAMFVRSATVSAGSWFNLQASGYDGERTTLQWYKDGVAIAGATGHLYSLYPVTRADAGEYYVIASNATGSTTSTTGLLRVTEDTVAPTGQWKQAVVASGVVYFLFENPARIERFRLASESWLAPIALARAPAAMAPVSPSAALIAFDLSLVKLDFESGVETPIITLAAMPIEMQVIGDRAYIQGFDLNSAQRTFTIVSLTDTPQLLSNQYNYDMGPGFAIDQDRDRVIFGRAWSGMRIRAFTLNQDGTLGGSIESSFLIDYDPAGSVTLRPDGGAMFVSSGFAYAPENLAEIGRIGERFESLAFADDGTALALRGSQVSAYTVGLKELGSIALSGPASKLVVVGDQLYAFSPVAAGAGEMIQWERHALDELGTPPAFPAVTPATVGYTPDDILVDRDGVVLIASRMHGNIFRWSSVEQRYLESIPLQGRPNSIAYLPSSHCIYTGYADGRVRVVDLAAGLEEKPFIDLGAPSASVTRAGEYLIVGEKASGTSKIYTSGARCVVTDIEGDVSRSNVWNPFRQRLYFLDPALGGIRYIQVALDGTIAAASGAFLHGGSHPPIRVSPDGETLFTAGGAAINVDTLRESKVLPYEVSDLAWLGTRLFTLRPALAGVEVQRWREPSFTPDASCTLTGHGVRLLACGEDRLLVITKRSPGRAAFTLLDFDLNIRNHFEDTPDLTRTRLANLSTRAEVGTGDNIMIAGFVVTGSQPKRVLVRAIGPSLKPYGVSGELADPVLHITTPEGRPVADNDNWYSFGGDSLKPIFAQVGAFGLPDDSLDAALVAELAPGSYTALVSSRTGTPGVALVEAYDLDTEPGVNRLINISTRAVVGTGNKVMIPGLVIGGETSKRVLIRAVGPGLAAHIPSGLLADPQLQVVNTDSETIVANDNWGEDNTDVTTAATTAAGAFGLAEGSRDAALVTTLPPGIYTVVVSGVGDTSGVVLVEVYEVP